MTLLDDTTTGRAPVDAHAFVADAQRITNERDVEAVRAVFAPDARQTVVLDGIVMTPHGVDEIVEQWRMTCDFMARRRLFVTKNVLSADGTTIVNDWTGRMGRRATPTGVEVWRFDENGLVSDHRLFCYLNVRDDRSVLQQLRLLLAYPVTALTYALVRRRRRGVHT